MARWVGMAVLLFPVACGSSASSTATSGTGGFTASGGSGGGGGLPSSSGTGGVPATGGANSSGGAQGTGGAPGSGGVQGVGGGSGGRAADGSGGSQGGGGAGGSTGGGGGSNRGSGGAAAGGGAGQTAVCPFGTREQFLWSGTAPGSAGVTLVEKFTDRSTDPTVQDRSVTGVSKPSLFPYLAAHPNGAAAIIIPGGGYTHLAFDKEGVDIAAWLNSLGVSAFVLKHRLPTDFLGTPWIALADAQRAIRTVRKNAATCAIDPARIGVIGFSAGGHLASQLETRFGAHTSTAQDDVDAVDPRPAFGVLMYPVISMDPAIAHAGTKTALLGANPTQADVNLYSSEMQVTSTTPATFLGVSNQDTTVNPQNSVRFDNALKTAGITQELHLYKDGTHGVGIRDATGDMAAWPQQAAAWLTGLKIISATN